MRHNLMAKKCFAFEKCQPDGIGVATTTSTIHQRSIRSSCKMYRIGDVHRWHWHTVIIRMRKHWNVYALTHAHVYRSMRKWNEAKRNGYRASIVYLSTKYKAPLISFTIFEEAKIHSNSFHNTSSQRTPTALWKLYIRLYSETFYTHCTCWKRQRNESSDLQAKYVQNPMAYDRLAGILCVSVDSVTINGTM